ncbi:MAG: NAD-dependent epimerase/dehydratase family protein [Pseudomonadota bacterium]
MSILITGATGCLGSNLTKKLVDDGNRVTIFRLGDDECKNLGEYSNKVTHKIGDVLNYKSILEAMDGINQVYHVAGVSIPLNKYRDVITKVNIEGTRNVLKAAFNKKIKKIVYTSSVSAIGISNNKSIDENFEYNGEEFDFAYMHSKYEAEKIAQHYHKQGLNIVIVNPSAVLAPGASKDYGWLRVIEDLKKSRVFFYVDGGVGIVTKNDMVDGHIKAMKHGISGQKYILNTTNISYKDLIKLISKEVGGKRIIFGLPNGILRFASVFRRFFPKRFGEMISPEMVELMTRHIYYDQSKSVKHLKASQTSLIESIKELV